MDRLNIIATLLTVLSTFTLLSQVEKVTINEKDGQWELKVEGAPYYVKGAGGTVQMDMLVACGGNTVRTWGTENAQEILDEAHSKGVKVMLGLWVQHERHGFDYNNKGAVEAQLERFRSDVRKYKNHPALLMWGIGNEYELNYSNTKVWAAVNDIAKMIHEEDPNHPTSTVTAGTNAEKVKFVMDELTEIDIYGINTYGDIGNVKGVLQKANFEGPYMITEWGPTGHWECEKTKWSSSIEQTSAQKCAVYQERYQSSIAAFPKQCIGSFAFLWGQKQEYTSTWYGLFTEDGRPTEIIDELQYCWSGSYPENRAPRIDSISVNDGMDWKNWVVSPSTKHQLQLFASDANSDQINYRWELYPESTDLKTGGDAEGKPPIITGKIKKGKSNAITLKAPFQEGRYRLFVFVDDQEKVAYMNIPFYVQNDPDAKKRVQFKKQDLKSFDEE